VRASEAVACFHCSRPVEGNYREVIGWERRRRRGGGQNQGNLGKRYTGRQACDECGYKLTRGIPLGQQSLFGTT
jgi:hypothetical protein